MPRSRLSDDDIEAMIESVAVFAQGVLLIASEQGGFEIGLMRDRLARVCASVDEAARTPRAAALMDNVFGAVEAFVDAAEADGRREEP